MRRYAALALVLPLLVALAGPAAAAPTPVRPTDAVRRAHLAVFRPSTGLWALQALTDVTFGGSGDVPVPADYNGDGRTDIAVWRPSTGVWWLRGLGQVGFGGRGDRPVPADYNRDGRTDIAIWRPSTGVWSLRGLGAVAFGQAGDVPVPADYNGDGRIDLAVWRPSTGVWWIRGLGHVGFGRLGDVPVRGDYNGDGRTDIAVWRPSTGVWWLRGLGQVGLGQAGDRPVPGDYDGNSTTDIAVWRPSTGAWWVRGRAPVTLGRAGDVPVAVSTPSTPSAPFHSVVTAAPAARMGASWHAGCPVPIADLRLLTVTHVGFDGLVHRGELVVHRSYAAALAGVMHRLYDARFPLRRIRLIDVYAGDDNRSMSDDNSSAFNCRAVTGHPGVWSQHSYGWAVDLNPYENPYVSGSTVLPTGSPYADRTRRAPGMIHAGDATVVAFRSVGWGWGGSWSSPKDYQHFSATGR